MAFFRYALTILLIFGLRAALLAEEQDTVALERIIVTSKRTAFDIGEAAENISVATQGHAQGLPARNLSEVLSYLPHVDIPTSKGFGRATSISIQGADSRQVRVMIDGIPLNTQSSGQVNPAEFPIENIERIEVVKGPLSSLWGSGLGGVINVITKETGTTLIPKGNIRSSYAGFRTRKNSADLSGKAGEFGYYILSSLMESGGRGRRDDVLEKKAFTKLSYDLRELGKITTSFGYSSADVNSGEFPNGTWQAQPYRDRYGKIGWENKLGGSDIKAEFKHFRKETTTKYFPSVFEDSPAPDNPVPRVDTKDILYQLSLNSSSRLRQEDLLVLGADFDYDALKSSPYLSQVKYVRLYAPYANYTLNLNPWGLNFGLRYDHNSEFGEQVSPALGAVYHFKGLAETLIRGGVSRAFNAPPLLWKFNANPGLGVAPSPDIKPERAIVYEAGMESRPLAGLWLKLDLYRSDVRDAISSELNDSGEVFKKNFQKFRRQGVEFQFRAKIIEQINFTGGAAFNDIEDPNTRQTVRGGGKPRQSFDTGVEYKNKSGTLVHLIGYYDRWNEPPEALPNDRKMILDLKISQTIKSWEIFFNTYNLANSKYWSDYFFPLPQRYFEGGVNFSW